MSANDIVHSEIWILGPSFLRGVHRDLAKGACSSHEVPDGDPEIKRPRKVTARSYLVDVTRPAEDIDLLINSYSTWYKLKRGIAWMLRFKSWLLSRVLKHPATDMNRALDVIDLRSAENAVVKYVQLQHFKQEMTTTATGGATSKPPNSKGNSLHGLRPILSDEWLLSIGGRLRKANLPTKRKHPVILPKFHHIAELIVKEYHETYGHTGREHGLSLIRQRYWIVSGRQTVRRVISKCFTCKRSNAKLVTQRMADLPSCRLQSDHPPFTFVGVDLFGPMLVKRGRSDVKRYGCIFTCLTVRAVHL